jgi:alpha-1,6-mannosyltransferase
MPGSPYGPHAAGLWPLEASGPAPGWEGPKVSPWAQVSDQARGVVPAHLLIVLAVVGGVVFLALAWGLLWRRVRTDPHLGLRRLWYVVGAWVTPLLLAAPVATQDVWTYGLEGHLVLDGFGGYRAGPLISHSVWTSGFDGTVIRPSPYGPFALDLSASFVKLSGGRPWVAAECWRLTAIVGLVLCAWGVTRIVSRRGGNATEAMVVAVANPAILVILVGGIHNDALMLGLIVAGIALALSEALSWGVVLCSLGVAVKSNALLAVGAVAWWAWGSRWRPRTKGAVVAATAVLGVLVVCGLGVGGGFGWLTALFSNKSVQGPWSIGWQFFGPERGWPVPIIEVTGLVLAVLLVLVRRRSGGWFVGLGWGFAALAVTNSRPEPWYLAWALVLLACGGLDRRSEQFGILVLGAMMLGSVLPDGTLWWNTGLVLLVWLGLVSLWARHDAPKEISVPLSPSETRRSQSVPVP